MIQIIDPPASMAFDETVILAKRLWDSGFTLNSWRTKSTSMFAYTEIWSGEEYPVFLKYSAALAIMFVALLYGVGMPALFPLSGLAILSLWACERIMLVRQLQLPPQMNDLLIKNALSVLKWGPLVLLLNAYWMIDNK